MQTDLQQQFAEYISAGNLFMPGDRLLLAVSGGVDSVVLCELCSSAGYDFAIAHCNFGLRGEESDADEELVKRLAERYGTDCFVKRFQTDGYAKAKKVSLQVAARELRYGWFAELMAEKADKPFRYLITAHHANDNIETLLMNFFKGTGMAGLQGIRPKGGVMENMARPLLFAKKEQLISFAGINGLEYREDSSNSSDKYTRNYIRNRLIPGLKEVFPQAEDNLLGNISRFRDASELYHLAVEEIKKKLIIKKGGELHLPVLKLLKTPALHTLVYEIISEFGFTPAQVEEVVRLLKSESGKYVESSTHRVLHNRNWLIISAKDSLECLHHVIHEHERVVTFANRKLVMEKMHKPEKIDRHLDTAQLDAALITFPLMLRKWKTGDYFYPLGMRKKKKLSRFFVDQKLSINEKQNTWVIEMDKKIIWIVGQRIDDRFKITPSTEEVYCIKLLSP